MSLPLCPDRKPYWTDVHDEDWSFVAPYLASVAENAPQRDYGSRELFNALCWIIFRQGASWRDVPMNFPPWQAVYEQTNTWIKAGCFEAIVHDLRAILFLGDALGRRQRAATAIEDLASYRRIGAIERSGGRRRKDRKLHVRVDTLGHLLALLVTPAEEQDRARADALCRKVQVLQEVTGQHVEVPSGEKAVAQALARGVELEVVKLPEAKNGFVLLPKLWILDRDYSWVTRCRGLAKHYEWLPAKVAGLQFVVFGCILLAKAAAI
jgi:transposase